jgi:hypothetical protein
MHGVNQNLYKMLVGKPEGKSPLRRPSVGGRLILKYILGKLDLGAWVGSIWLKIGTGGGLL